MKYPLYILASVVLFAGASLGVASAASDNGLTGVVAKLEEVKTAILGLTLSVPSPLDVNVVSPDPLNVTVTNYPEGESQAREPKLIKVFDHLEVPATPGVQLVSDSISVEGYTKGSLFASASAIPNIPSQPRVSLSLNPSHDGENFFSVQGNSVSSASLGLTAVIPTGQNIFDLRAPYVRLQAQTSHDWEHVAEIDAWLYLMP